MPTPERFVVALWESVQNWEERTRKLLENTFKNNFIRHIRDTVGLANISLNADWDPIAIVLFEQVALVLTKLSVSPLKSDLTVI
jgi:hypothetical protein